MPVYDIAEPLQVVRPLVVISTVFAPEAGLIMPQTESRELALFALASMSYSLVIETPPYVTELMATPDVSEPTATMRYRSVPAVVCENDLVLLHVAEADVVTASNAAAAMTLWGHAIATAASRAMLKRRCLIR